MHDITWKIFSGSYGANWSLVRPFVNMYLMRDGSRFTDRPDYATLTYDQEFVDRDCALPRPSSVLITSGPSAVRSSPTPRTSPLPPQVHDDQVGA